MLAGTWISRSVDRYRWTNCLASTHNWFKSTGFLLVGPYLSPVDDIESLRNRIVAGFQTTCNMPGNCDRLRVAMRHQAEAFVQTEMDTWNIYCKVMWRAEAIDLNNSETMHLRIYVDVNYFYYLHMRKSFFKLCRTFLGPYDRPIKAQSTPSKCILNKFETRRNWNRLITLVWSGI
jgi:hypothetical protein